MCAGGGVARCAAGKEKALSRTGCYIIHHRGDFLPIKSTEVIQKQKATQGNGPYPRTGTTNHGNQVAQKNTALALLLLFLHKLNTAP